MEQYISRTLTYCVWREALLRSFLAAKSPETPLKKSILEYCSEVEELLKDDVSFGDGVFAVYRVLGRIL